MDPRALADSWVVVPLAKNSRMKATSEKAVKIREMWKVSWIDGVSQGANME